LQETIRVLSEHPEESIPKASQNSTVSQSIYRFWSNKKVSSKQINESHRPSVLKRVNSQKVVLAIQDTTDLNFSGLKKTEGLGFINQSKQQGIKVHSCLAVSGEGEPLGILHQQTWVRTERKGKKDKRRQKATKEKESQRWLDTLKESEKGVDKSVCVLHIGDREADIYDLFVQPRQDNSELLIRAEHNRKVQHELGYLIPTLEQAPIIAEKTIEIGRKPKKSGQASHLNGAGDGCHY